MKSWILKFLTKIIKFQLTPKFHENFCMRMRSWGINVHAHVSLQRSFTPHLCKSVHGSSTTKKIGGRILSSKLNSKISKWSKILMKSYSTFCNLVNFQAWTINLAISGYKNGIFWDFFDTVKQTLFYMGINHRWQFFPHFLFFLASVRVILDCKKLQIFKSICILIIFEYVKTSHLMASYVMTPYLSLPWPL